MTSEEWAYGVLAGALKRGLEMDLADRVKALEEEVAALKRELAALFASLKTTKKESK